jgi:hypothetical protein
MLVENAPGAWVTTVPHPMFNIYAYSFGGPIKVTFTELPPGRWDVYGYGHGEGDRESTSFEIDSAGVHYGPLLTSDAPGWRKLPWVEGAQYVVLRDVEARRNESFVITASGVHLSTPFLNGLQLVPSKGGALALVPAGGWFTNRLSVAIASTRPGREIRYTVDGSVPTLSSALYQSPITLLQAAVLKARAFRGTEPDSDVVSGEFVRIYAIDDGIPAEWRRRNFGDGYLSDPRVSADADPDNDGANNLQEYTAGSDPLDSLSGFALSVIQVPSISWVSTPGKTYRILRKQTLSETVWEVYKLVTAVGTQTRFTDDGASNGRYFYTVEPVR